MTENKEVWFAWYPVIAKNYGWVWLVNVLREKIVYEDDEIDNASDLHWRTILEDRYIGYQSKWSYEYFPS